MASSYPNNYGNMKEDRMPVVPQEVTIGMPDSPSSVDISGPEKPWDPAGLIVSVVSYFCCCLPGHICGFIGVIMSLMSYSDHRSKNFVGAQSKRRWALGCGITALILGTVLIIVVVALYFAGVNMILTQINHMQHQDNMNNELHSDINRMRDETDHLQDRVGQNWQDSLNEMYQRIGDRVASGTTKRPDYIY